MKKRPPPSWRFLKPEDGLLGKYFLALLHGGGLTGRHHFKFVGMAPLVGRLLNLGITVFIITRSIIPNNLFSAALMVIE
eukprot:jgi/Tetstr1/458763/TSEL_045147.t1